MIQVINEDGHDDQGEFCELGEIFGEIFGSDNMRTCLLVFDQTQ